MKIERPKSKNYKVFEEKVRFYAKFCAAWPKINEKQRFALNISLYVNKKTPPLLNKKTLVLLLFRSSLSKKAYEKNLLNPPPLGFAPF